MYSSDKFTLLWNKDFLFPIQGFGDILGEHWLGNEIISKLTQEKQHVLRIDLTDWEGNTAFSKYEQFSLDGEKQNYRWRICASKYLRVLWLLGCFYSICCGRILHYPGMWSAQDKKKERRKIHNFFPQIFAIYVGHIFQVGKYGNPYRYGKIKDVQMDIHSEIY